MNKKKYIYALAFVAVFFIGIHSLSAIKLSYESTQLSSGNNQDKIEAPFDSLTDKKIIAADFSMKLRNNNLPVSDVDIYDVENPEGVVVFIPQTHVTPGTSIEDPVNDSAEEAQKEIYDIISYLNEEEKVNLIMVEGEKFGLVPDAKISNVEKKIDIRDNFQDLSEDLKSELNNESVSDEKINSLLYALENEIKFLDREIALNGAPYEAKAENDNFIVYGSENPDTYQECSKIVTNYIYQKDRLSVLEGKNSPVSGKLAVNDKLAQLKTMLEGKYRNLGASSINNASVDTVDAASELNLGSVKNLYNYLLDNSISISDMALRQSRGLLGGASSLDESLEEIKLIGENRRNQNIINITDNISSYNNELGQLRNEKSAETASASRSDNPYDGINDKEIIKKEIKSSEDQIQEMIIDKRNLETAENFKQALIETNNNIGMLQFGAGHEEGLINEMNAQNLTVVVVKSNEVFQRENE